MTNEHVSTELSGNLCTHHCMRYVALNYLFKLANKDERRRHGIPTSRSNDYVRAVIKNAIIATVIIHTASFIACNSGLETDAIEFRAGGTR